MILLFPPELQTNVTAFACNGGEVRTQCTNSGRGPILTIEARRRSCVKILSVASHKALYPPLTLSLFGACVASACRVTALLLLRQCWTLGDFLKGAKSGAVFMIRWVYVGSFTLCASVFIGQRHKFLPWSANEAGNPILIQKFFQLIQRYYKGHFLINSHTSGLICAFVFRFKLLLSVVH